MTPTVHSSEARPLASEADELHKLPDCSRSMPTASSQLPCTVGMSRRRSSSTTSFGCGPRPTTSPTHQIASQPMAAISASTARSAGRLAWMSPMTAIRIAAILWPSPGPAMPYPAGPFLQIGLAGSSHGEWRRHHADPPSHGTSDLAQGLPGARMVRIGMLSGGDRRTRIAARAYARLQGNSAEHLEVELAGDSLAAAGAEDVVLLAAVRADEAAHVLDHAQDSDVDLVEHRDRLARIGQGDLLRRGHDHRPGERDQLADGERGVTRSRRQVDDEVVELAPLDVAQELLDRRVDERPPPDDRRVAGQEVLDAHHRDAMADDRVDAPAGAGDVGAAGTHHERDVRSGDVGVEQANPGTIAGQADREVDGDRGLADASLARCHRDRVLHAWDEIGRRPAERALHVARPVDLHRFGAQALEAGDDLVLDLGLQRAGRRRELDGERHVRPGDLDVLHHAQRDEVTPDLRVLDLSQGSHDVLVGEHGGHASARSFLVSRWVGCHGAYQRPTHA